MQNLEQKAQEEVKKYKIHLRYLGIIALIIAFFLSMNFFRNGHRDNLIKDVITYKDSANHYKNKFNESVTTNKVLVLDDQRQLRFYLNAMSDTMKNLIDKYKKIISVTHTKEYFYYHDSIAIQPSAIPCNFKPFELVKREKFFTLKGTLSKNEFSIDSLFFPNQQSVVIGIKHTGFFKKEYTADVENTNPYIKTTNLGAYAVTFKPKWYERPSVWAITGLLTGFIVGKTTGR